MQHKKELEKMLPLWNKIDIPVFYLQSKKDGVVYSSNAEFAKQYLINVPFLKIHLFEGRKHNIDSKHHIAIRNKLIELLKFCRISNTTIGASLSFPQIKKFSALTAVKNLQTGKSPIAFFKWGC